MTRKSMFSNACFFRIGAGFVLPPLDDLERALQKGRFIPCGPTQPESSGWIAPRGEKSTQLAEMIGGRLVLKLCTERRSVPADAVKAAVQGKVDVYLHETGATRVPAKLKKEFKEEAILSLLPRAFPRSTTTTLWLDTESRLLVVDSATIGGPSDRIISALLNALVDLGGCGDDLNLQFIHTQMSPAGAMAHWLVNEAPFAFTVDRDCELKTPDELKSTVRYTRHTLDIEEVAQHIAAGKAPTSLAMTWNDRVSFVFTEVGTLRKITLLDVFTEGSEEQGADGFDADVAITTGELSRLIPDLLQALGGEIKEE